VRPPICAVCHDRFSPREGGTVQFANFESLPEGIVGHPKGLEWFCPVHIGAARGLSDLSSGDAVRQISG